MTWNEAAEQILKKERMALNYNDLAQKILKAKLVETSGKTPHLTLHASISLENKNREERGIPIRFILERGQVSLSEWSSSGSETSFLQQSQKLRATAKSELLKHLRGLSGDRFESFIEALLIKMGYENVQLRGGSGDEGVDLLCEMSQGINQIKTAVQGKCKQAHNKVGPNAVRLLRDVLPRFQCSQGVLITTSSFTKEAIEAANEQGRLPIILIDGDQTAELAVEHEVGVRSQQIKAYFLDSEYELFK